MLSNHLGNSKHHAYFRRTCWQREETGTIIVNKSSEVEELHRKWKIWGHLSQSNTLTTKRSFDRQRIATLSESCDKKLFVDAVQMMRTHEHVSMRYDAWEWPWKAEKKVFLYMYNSLFLVKRHFLPEGWKKKKREKVSFVCRTNQSCPSSLLVEWVEKPRGIVWRWSGRWGKSYTHSCAGKYDTVFAGTESSGVMTAQKKHGKLGRDADHHHVLSANRRLLFCWRMSHGSDSFLLLLNYATRRVNAKLYLKKWCRFTVQSQVTWNNRGVIHDAGRE